MAWLPWAWLLLAMIFGIAEAFTAGFFLICFSAGAGVAALLAFAGLGPLWQFGAFVVASGAAVLLSRPLASRMSNPQTHPVGTERILGREGIVVETIDPVSGRGVVRVGHERWSADSVEGRIIVAGSHVLVVDVNGAHLKVRPLVSTAVLTHTSDIT